MTLTTIGKTALPR